MTQLESGTDLFDLFGQTGTCAICQEDMCEGERVRAVRGCDHLFHAACVEPWLLSRGTCPHCRKVVLQQQPVAGAIASTTEAMEALRTAVAAAGHGPEVAGLLVQIEQLMGQTQSALTARRALLTYCLGAGILSRFGSAATFNPVREGLRAGLATFEFEGVRPHRMGCDRVSSFYMDYITARETLEAAYPNQGAVHRLPDVVAMRTRLEAARSSSQFLRDFWRRTN